MTTNEKHHQAKILYNSLLECIKTLELNINSLESYVGVTLSNKVSVLPSFTKFFNQRLNNFNNLCNFLVSDIGFNTLCCFSENFDSNHSDSNVIDIRNACENLVPELLYRENYKKFLDDYFFRLNRTSTVNQEELKIINSFYDDLNKSKLYILFFKELVSCKTSEANTENFLNDLDNLIKKLLETETV